MRKDYVLLTFNEENQPGIYTRKSWWRTWNRLSRLQRNLISFFSILFLVTFIILWIQSHEGTYRISSSFIYTTERSGDLTPIVEDYKIKKVAYENNIERGDALLPPFRIIEDVQGTSEGLKFDFSKTINTRQEAVVNAFRHAWRGYKQWAWGHDNLKPLKPASHDWFNLGLSIVDSLDTMYMMNLKDDYLEARDWVDKKLSFNEFNDVNLFEVTIRVLGGLLAAFHLTNDSMYKYKAKDLGERLMPCFTRSPSPIPYSDVNLASHSAHSPRWSPDSSTSEVTTIQLEFRDLSRITNDAKFEYSPRTIQLILEEEL